MTIRSNMLAIARELINTRAVRDGYPPYGYDGTGDEEGYIVGILESLQHWCAEYMLDWPGQLARAQQLFEEDVREDQNAQP